MPEQRRAPIVRAGQSISGAIDKFSHKTLLALQDFDGSLRSTTRFDRPDAADETTLLKTLPIAGGDVLDGTVLSVGREGYRISTRILNLCRAVYNTPTRIPLHPETSWKDPKKYLANPIRVGSETANLATDLINFPFRVLDDIGNRAIRRSVQRISHKIPLIGGAIGKLADGVAWTLNLPRRFTEWATSPVERWNAAVAAHQNRAPFHMQAAANQAIRQASQVPAANNNQEQTQQRRAA